jgi:hypothetical protein
MDKNAFIKGASKAEMQKYESAAKSKHYCRHWANMRLTQACRAEKAPPQIASV